MKITHISTPTVSAQLIKRDTRLATSVGNVHACSHINWRGTGHEFETIVVTADGPFHGTHELTIAQANAVVQLMKLRDGR